MDDFGNLIGAPMPGVLRGNLFAYFRFAVEGGAEEVSESALKFYGLIA